MTRKGLMMQPKADFIASFVFVIIYIFECTVLCPLTFLNEVIDNFDKQYRVDAHKHK